MTRWLVMAAALAACGSENLADKLPDGAPPPCDPTTRVFVNFDGGDYTNGPNDPVANTIELIDSYAPLAASALSETARGEVAACLTDLFEPYRLALVYDDPALAPHHEIVVTSTPVTDVSGGWPEGQRTFGAAICDPAASSKILGFVFSSADGMTPELVCYALAWRLAAFAEAPQTTNCLDITYPVEAGWPGCPGGRTIRDAPIECLSDYCSQCDESNEVNVHELLAARYGVCSE